MWNERDISCKLKNCTENCLCYLLLLEAYTHLLWWCWMLTIVSTITLWHLVTHRISSCWPSGSPFDVFLLECKLLLPFESCQMDIDAIATFGRMVCDSLGPDSPPEASLPRLSMRVGTDDLPDACHGLPVAEDQMPSSSQRLVGALHQCMGWPMDSNRQWSASTVSHNLVWPLPGVVALPLLQPTLMTSLQLSSSVNPIAPSFVSD